jgi:ABC-type sulfate/molybdate transport systems ATPase subunit
MAPLDLDIAVALRDHRLAVALSVGRETLALAGPSGAGKTTVLRGVAGLHRPDEGRIALGGDVWFDAARGIDRPPERRSAGLVFQDYALFPHLSVRENVAFGGRERAGELIERFGIGHLADERPGRLSGGERQRVALARALARDPGVLLLDEPLSALDAQTRTGVRDELHDVLAELALPAILVTHDFADAAALADRVGVLVDGRIRQVGPAAALAVRPADPFVARFAGANVLDGVADGLDVRLDGGGRLRTGQPARGRVALAVAPWRIALHAAPPAGGLGIPGAVTAVTPDAGRLRVRLAGLVAEVEPARAAGLDLDRGAVLWATAEPADVRVIGPPPD